MKSILTTLFFCCFLIIQSQAQSVNLYLNGGAIGYSEGESYPVAGLGLEVKASKRWTVFGDFNFGSKSNVNFNSTLVDRSIRSIESGVRFYFKDAFRGFNISTFGVYGVEKVDPVENVIVPHDWRSADRTGVGLALGYKTILVNGLSAGFNSALSSSFQNNASRFQFQLQLGYSF